MDRVAAKIAEEVGVFFQHRDIDAGAREQEAEHHAGRTAAGDDAAGRGHEVQMRSTGSSTMLLSEATSGPSLSVASRTAAQSGSARNAFQAAFIAASSSNRQT
jgi:hypothetical protein